jgi:hypothetical protein
MAKPDDTDQEKTALFGDMTDAQRLDMTDEELAGIDGDEDDGEEGDEEETDEAGEGDEGEAEKAGEGEGEEAGDEAGEADAEGDEGEGEGEDDEAGEGDDAGTGEGADTTGEEAAAVIADDEDDPLDVTRSVMPNEWQLPKDANDKLKGLTDQAADLAEKFDSGDLTAREYHTQREALDDQRNALKTQIGDATKAWQKGLNDWANRTVKAFMRDHKEYDGTKNPTLNRMLDAEVRALQTATNDPFNPRILRQAHANIQAALGKAPDTPAAKPAGKTGKAAAAKPPVLPGKKKPAVPPTLARVPQDQVEDANGGKFARLDRLSARDPHAFEVAMSKMSPADRDEYLAGAS